MDKTAKQKCLEMWEWLRDNPGSEKGDYYDYLTKIGKENEYCYCWACRFNHSIRRNESESCKNCPIVFPIDDYGYPNCEHKDSPYYKWVSDSFSSGASDMVKLIKETWNE